MPVPKDDAKICLRCEENKKPLGKWYHPDIVNERVLVWNAVCTPCISELNAADYTALDVIALENARMRYEKEYDYSE